VGISRLTRQSEGEKWPLEYLKIRTPMDWRPVFEGLVLVEKPVVLEVVIFRRAGAVSVTAA
jgi:hypothetical protein